MRYAYWPKLFLLEGLIYASMGRRYLMPDQSIPAHVISMMIRPRHGFRLWFS